jgi:hypothetical protein
MRKWAAVRGTIFNGGNINRPIFMAKNAHRQCRLVLLKEGSRGVTPKAFGSGEVRGMKAKLGRQARESEGKVGEGVG